LDNWTTSVTPVPEPSTFLLVISAAIALVIHRRLKVRRRLARAIGLRTHY
jgi:hypothetical protein